MWVPLLRIALVLAGGVAYAESANESISGLESCFQAARVADEICSKAPDDPGQRVECFKKARAAQLECLEHVLSEMPTAKTDPKNSPDRAQTATPAQPAPQEQTSQGQARTDSGQTETPSSFPVERGNERPRPSPNLNEAGVPPATQELPTGAIEPQPSAKREEDSSRAEDWVVSETTSPVDYSPVVTALIHSISDATNGPNVLGLRCRARRTEFLIRAEGGWNAPNGKELRVDLQINDQPIVRLPWIVSADGKTATYRDDPVEFLRSIPEGASVKVAAANKENIRREATFRLTGLSAVRHTVGTACNWAPGTAKTSDAIKR
jgi:hypothetical protein